MTDEQIIEWARAVDPNWSDLDAKDKDFSIVRAFVHLVRNATLEEVDDAYSDALQSDLEHGVRALSERAAKEFKAKYPELAKFSDTIRAMKECP